MRQGAGRAARHGGRHRRAGGRLAFQEADRHGARLCVLRSRAHRHLAPELPSPVPARSPGHPGQEWLTPHSRAEEAVPRYALTRLRERYPAIEVEIHAVPAAPADVLLEATREAAVVVTGARHRTTVLGARLGAVAHTLLHRAHRPVVVVPNA
ncbi:universal stress protein [Streptomyces europaeiscabiei]|uniref:universal stress protein n=1 Tax=Streptomyces europaeiscabiei TaxID=146819 RepID=UPI0029BEB355|nr:universal stress protein [Streptomyces europaeiscabiei]MDX2524582.1 universal stress protein [Streptomyces europaeiscabiei]